MMAKTVIQIAVILIVAYTLFAFLTYAPAPLEFSR